MSTTGNTIRLHRVLKAPSERVYRAFLDPDAFAQWLPPEGFTCKIHSRNAIVGGKYEISFTNFTTQSKQGWTGEFLDLVPSKVIQYSDQFNDPHLTGKMQTTVTLKEVVCGTEIQVVQENVPSVIPPEMCYLGWQESLQKLAQLVEPEMKEG